MAAGVLAVAVLSLTSFASGQFFDDYSSDTEYKGKFIGTLNSYHHQVIMTHKFWKLFNPSRWPSVYIF
jgi:hypothetical protein